MRKTSRAVNSIFRGGLIKSLINMIVKLFMFSIALVKIGYRIIRIPMKLGLWIICLDYSEIELRIVRGLRKLRELF